MKAKLMVILMGALFLSLSAEAKPAFFKKFKATYPTTKLNTCVVCHIGEDDYARNSYGDDLEKNQINFKATEQLDSDGDGKTNLEEIIAGTLPGDKSSVPTAE